MITNRVWEEMYNVKGYILQIEDYTDNKRKLKDDEGLVPVICKALRDKRNEMIEKHHYTLRQLYRIMDSTPENPVSEIQTRLDNAVRDAYGMRHDADIPQFLLDLNGKVFEKEQNGEKVQGPGLPNKIKDKSKLVSNDCIKMI